MDDAVGQGGGTGRLDPVLAGVVVFHPDASHLRALVETLRRQTAGVILFLNSALPDDLQRDFTAAPDVHLISATENLGIGVGLNVIALSGLLRNAAGLIVFDQDSTPPSTLVDELTGAWQALAAVGRRPAVVAPRLVTAQGSASKAPTYRYGADRVGAAQQVAFVPTSGSLISTDVLRRIGLFRADFFIDGIDLEWSFRAVHAGYSCWIHTACTMPHAVGSGVIGGGWMRWRMPKQRPFRMYCVIRNTLYGLRLRHIPLGWKVKQLAYLPLQAGAFAMHHRMRWAILKQLANGLRDGLTGRLGPPRDFTG